MRFLMLLFYALVGLSLVFSKQSWTIDSIVLEITSSEATNPSRIFSITSESDRLWTFGSSDILELRFNVKRGSHAAQPHQTMLLIGHPETHLETTLLVPVDANGKASLKLTHRQIPLPLLFSDKSLMLTLVIASFGNAVPLLYKLGRLEIVDIRNDIEQPTLPLRYGPLPEISHEFSSGPKKSSKGLVLIFSIAIVAAFWKLIRTWRITSLDGFTLSSIMVGRSISYVIFLMSLLGVEILFYLYWTHIRLYQVFMGVLVLLPFLFFSGRNMLSDMQKKRLQQS